MKISEESAKVTGWRVGNVGFQDLDGQLIGRVILETVEKLVKNAKLV